MIKYKKTFENALWVVLFAGLFYFNFYVHPQVILDYDDWSYVSYFRVPIPWPTFWNPSRVLPELLMPLAGFAGSLVYRLFPGLGYIMAETLVFSVIITAFEFVYVFMTARFIVQRFSLSRCYGVFVAVMFLLMHFWAFRTELIRNEYLLRTTNLTCCFFYLIPVLLNYISVFVLEKNRELLKDFLSADDWKKKLFMLILLYFSVFSNLFANVIIAVYAFIRIVLSLFERRTADKRKNIIAFLKENSAYFLILLMWVVSLMFDAFGGRAKVSYGTIDSYGKVLFEPESIKQIFGSFGSVLRGMNKLFAIISLLTIISAVLMLLFDLKAKREGSRQRVVFAVILLVSQLLITVYVVLLSLVVYSEYIYRSDVLITVFGSFFIILCFAVVYVSTKLKAGVWPVIAICIIAAVMSNTPGYTFKDSYSIDITLSPEKCIAVSQDLVDQVIAAEANGQSEMDLYVMLTINMGCQNWPQCSYMQDVFKTTMVRHGIMKGDIAINSVIPSEDFNQKYNLDFSEMLLLGK